MSNDVVEIDGRQFPILLNWRVRSAAGKRSIPWAVIAPHEKQARFNHYQTLNRIAERGGLSWPEAAAVLADREWRPMSDDEAEAAVMDAVAAHLLAAQSEKSKI